MKKDRNYLEPSTISKLSRMDLKARLVVEGFITGLHRSPYHGFSVEFAEHRQYMPGDEIKHIDWKVYGKSDRFYIKQYEEETNLKSYILLDASASMAYQSEKTISKLEYGSYLAAALAYLMLRQQDAVGLVTFDENIRTFIPPKASISHIHMILKELDNLKAGGRTQVSDTFHQLAEKIKRRGLIIVISDLFDDPEKLLGGLKHFRHRKHEVIVFHVLDRYEREFPFDREAVFEDMETGERILTQPWQIRAEYQDRLRKLSKEYRLKCRERLIDYVPIHTETPYDVSLLAFLGKRQRLN
ncbi:MAG: DUF58 domain-containing protein [Candidatus Cloacimonetes bacterium 4572_55]|nr:MAG: DUF58 domain-containing protein [Candidatus Cloacimonetes bacterium 4572_55]